MFTLAISYLTTSNWCWFIALTFQVPMWYCSLQHHTFIPSPVTSKTGNCFCFGSISSFSGVFSPLLSSKILGTYQTREIIFQYHYLFPLYTVHGVLMEGILKWFVSPFSSDFFPGSSNGKAYACNVGDSSLIPGSGRSPGEGNANPLQHSCLENPMDWGAW